MPSTYLDKLYAQARGRFLKLAAGQEKELIEAYNRAGRDLVHKFNATRGGATKWQTTQYARQLYQEQMRIIQKYGMDASAISGEIHQFIMIQAGLGNPSELRKIFQGASEAAFAYIKGPNMYADGMTLSQRIWGSSSLVGKNIQDVVLAGMSRGQSAISMAKALEAYVTPGAWKEWDHDKLAEILGPDYAKWNNRVEYNALRLARTTITHSFTMGSIQAAKENPLCEGLKWRLSSSHSERMHGRTDICDKYATEDAYGMGPGVFPIDQVPFEHPNGLCIQSPYFGEESIEDLASEVAAWTKGAPNSRLDNWFKSSALNDNSENDLTPDKLKSFFNIKTENSVFSTSSMSKPQVLKEWFNARGLKIADATANKYMKALNEFTGGEWDAIRRYQSSGIGTKDVIKKTETLDEFMRVAPKWNGKIYRGIYIKDPSALSQFQEGATMSMGGTSSWSTNQAVANRFSKRIFNNTSFPGVRITMELQNSNRAVNIQRISKHYEEAEVLLSGDSKIIIKSIIQDSSNPNNFHMIVEEVAR